MKTKILTLIIPLCACNSAPEDVTNIDYTMCKDPRPEVCTMDYNPVCGLRSDGTEIKTFGNACTACSEKETIEYKTGEC